MTELHFPLLEIIICEQTGYYFVFKMLFVMHVVFCVRMKKINKEKGNTKSVLIEYRSCIVISLINIGSRKYTYSLSPVFTDEWKFSLLLTASNSSVFSWLCDISFSVVTSVGDSREGKLFFQFVF